MTFGEAIEIIKDERDNDVFVGTDYRRRVHEAMTMAIEALEQQIEDAISRQAVLDINEKHHGQMPNHVNHQIWEEMKELPSVFEYKPINIFKKDDMKPEDRALMEGLREGAYQAGARGGDVEFYAEQGLKRLGRYDLLPPCCRD